MPDDPPPECPPPGGAGWKPIDALAHKPIEIGTPGRLRFYGHPERDCGAIVSWVHSLDPLLVNVTAFLNQRGGSSAPLSMQNIGPWEDD